MPANTIILTVETSQAPDAKPVVVSLVLSTNWKTLISVPNYLVPELVFGGSTTIEKGVGEVISPLMLCNITANTALVDLRVHRDLDNIEYYILKNLAIPSYDTIPVPLNGQFFKTGDELEIICSANLAVHATLSFTLGQSEEDDV
jgi:hypothetical protein